MPPRLASEQSTKFLPKPQRTEHKHAEKTDKDRRSATYDLPMVKHAHPRSAMQDQEKKKKKADRINQSQAKVNLKEFV